MDKTSAQRIVRETFKASFDKKRYRDFISELLNGFDESKAQPMAMINAFKEHVKSCWRLGTFESPEGELADVLVVHLTESFKLERTRTALRDFVAHKLKRGEGEDNSYKEAALVAFVAPDLQSWRFSYVRMEYATKRDPKTGKIKPDERLTPARRYSYLVGTEEECHTAQSRFLALLQNTTDKPTLSQIEESFSVESVTKEFFGEYARLFGDTEAALAAIVKSDKTLRDDFEAKGVSTVDFAKKLLGQIVFLYFILKKGWLGVAKGGKWGDGQRNFLRLLADRAISEKKCLFNDVLEPLFYDTLATDRGNEAWCKTFACRIPFLNGGLFEPLAGYDWVKTNISFSNRLFTNQELSAAGDTGTGILDVFDRYNFTVNEAEPLEKEVAIDPEMLGMVFENLLELKERKSKGSFYTPREIVHYMCQESLLSYLDSALNHPTMPIGAAAPQPEKQPPLFVDSSEKPKDKAAQEEFTEVQHRVLVARKDLEEWIRQSDQFAHYAAAIAAGTKGEHYPKPPETIRKFAREIDELLRDITVCDPAIGSGAFPVGMMTEIVRARLALTPYFNDVAERTPYYFKRHAIQSCLYGVDIDVGAVEIAKLRLWLSLVVDEDDVRQIKPLPNLDYKVVVGNSLMGVVKNLFNNEQFKRLETLKPKFFDETNRTKKADYKRQIEKLIHELTNGLEVFDFEIYFSEVFHANGGFDVVIANPPYLFARNSEAKGLTHEAKRYFYEHYTLAEYQVNLYPLFIEKADRILAKRGTLTFITPNNWLTINTNKTLRRFVLGKSNILIVNFYARVFESADVDSSILIYEKGQHNPHVRLLEYTDTFHELKSAPTSFFASQRESVINVEMFKGSGGEADIVARIEERSIPLKAIAEVKSGLKAYEVGKGTPSQTKEMKDERVYHSRVKKHGAGWTPYLQGRDVCRYALAWSGEYLHYGDHLAAPRRDFRLFSTKRILVRQIPNKPPYCIHACYAEDTVLNDLNSLNIISIRANPQAVLAILNSRLISFWFVLKFGKLQRGLFPQFKANELADFPIPKKLSAFETQLAALAEEATQARLKDPTADIARIDREIDLLVCRAFELDSDDMKLIEAAS
jgi:type I restriction-modification system DNA methylase subunit